VSNWRLPATNDIPQNSKALLLSSFFNDRGQLREFLAQVTERGITGCLVQVVTNDELTFPFSGRVKFENATGASVFQSNQARGLKTEYLKKLADNQHQLNLLALSCGWTFFPISVEQDPREILGLCIQKLGMC
jgi:hypothetical protein